MIKSPNKTQIWPVPNNLTEDSLSRYLREFTFDIHAFAHQPSSPTNVCDYRVVGDFELLFVMSGQSLITIGQTLHHFTKGDIALIPPFIRNKIDTPPEDPHDNYFIHFDVFPFYRQAEFQQLLEQAIERCTEELFSDFLHPLLVQMEQERARKGPGSTLLLELLFRQLLLSLLRHGFEDTLLHGHIGTAEENVLLDQAIRFIQANIEKPIKIQDICEYLHISESYLHKTFSGKMNLSPNYMILLCKVKRAEQLLKTGNYSIKEISERLCFSSQYYFSTVFKRYYGISPRLFQNSLFDTHKHTSTTQDL